MKPFYSFDYEDAGYEEANLVKVDILINDVLVPELSAGSFWCYFLSVWNLKQ